MRNIRDDFPLFRHDATIYFDSAATTQKPDCVIDAAAHYYRYENANPLRGLYDLSEKATVAYESARETVRAFIGAASTEEIIFTRNATESVNLVAYTYGRSLLSAGDEVVITILEHHSNILPWQRICRESGATLKYLYCDAEGHIPPGEIETKITARTKIVSVTQVSNVLGQHTPLASLIAAAHAVGAVVLVDGSQGIPHEKTDVRAMDCDFYVFSGHKMFAPMGIGVLYGKKDILLKTPVFLTGGEMIDWVGEQDATFTELPHRFEAGTVNCSGAVGLGEAIRYLDGIGYDAIARVDRTLTDRLYAGLKSLPYIDLIGSSDASEHHGIVPFNIRDVHPHDAASILNEEGIALRAGHHCAQPLLAHLGCRFCLRASVYVYNTEEEVDQFLDALTCVRGVMGL